MSSKRQRYIDELGRLRMADPDSIRAFLRAESHLPGPRGNLELADAFADWAPTSLVDALAKAGSPRPAAGGDEFVDFCIALSLGERLARNDDPALVALLREIARDERWRVREAVATGLQRVGDREFSRLRDIVLVWAEDPDPLVQRAAAAAICEPRLLVPPGAAATAITVCERTTGHLGSLAWAARREPDVRVLRQALGYCWSVAISADPGPGLAAFAVIESSADPDVAWIVRENRKKARLKRLLGDDPDSR